MERRLIEKEYKWHCHWIRKGGKTVRQMLPGWLVYVWRSIVQLHSPLSVWRQWPSRFPIPNQQRETLSLSLSSIKETRHIRGRCYRGAELLKCSACSCASSGQNRSTDISYKFAILDRNPHVVDALSGKLLSKRSNYQRRSWILPFQASWQFV